MCRKNTRNWVHFDDGLIICYYIHVDFLLIRSAEIDYKEGMCPMSITYSIMAYFWNTYVQTKLFGPNWDITLS